MFEITRVSLENDMDLVLAHRQGMKLAEVAGLSVAGQTSFATAVSEVCRNIVKDPEDAVLILGIALGEDRQKRLTAIITDTRIHPGSEGWQYARRLVDTFTITSPRTATHIELATLLPQSFNYNIKQLERWSVLLNNDPSVSPYEEIKRKNRQLQEMTTQLKHSEQQYRTLTETLPLVILTLDVAGNVVYANNWLLEYTGETIESLNASKWANVIHPEDMESGWQDFANATTDRTPWKAERRLKDAATNEYRWHEAVMTPVIDDKDNLLLWNSFMTDVHARKEIEQALKDNKELTEIKEVLEEKNAELKQSNEALEQFAYVTSHDLQEPLRKISFYTDYLTRKFNQELPAEAKGLLQNMVGASDRMRQLIYGILTFSTINKKTGYEPVDVNAVIQEAIDDMELAIREKNALINIGAIPAIDGIRMQLLQLFENLISNSLKFISPDRRPEINITAETENNLVTIELADNGIGFDEKHLNKIFDLFQRLHSREKYAGTGIGLGICRKIMNIHNGDISARSNPGEGATFVLKFPIKQDLPA